MSRATPVSGDQFAVLVGLVERIIRVDFDSEDAHTAAIFELESMVTDPRVSEYIYYWDRHFDTEPKPTDIVHRALAYQPIRLGATSPDQVDPVIRG